MLKRKISEKVFINPYEKVTGIIIDSKEKTQPFNMDYDYYIELYLDSKNIGNEYFREQELDFLELNYEIVQKYKINH